MKRAIHLDFHTMPGIYDFQETFDAEVFAKTLKGAKVEYINAVVQCNLGFCYFPTNVLPAGGKKVSFRAENGYTVFELPEITGYQMFWLKK